MTTTTNPRRPRTPHRVSASSTRRSLRQFFGRLDVRLSPYLYIAPFFLLFLVVGLFPILYTAFVSVHDWDLIGGQGDLVGFDNFAAVLGSTRFWLALRNTFSIFLLSSVPQLIAAIVIAYVLDANLRAKTLWRMGVLVPYVVAPVAVSLIFGKLFAEQSGLINIVLRDLSAAGISWQSDPFWAHIAIATMVNFRWTGYNALIFLPAMQAVPRELYEAAIVDGAGRVRRFFSVTVPMLRATIIFVVITSTIGGLQIFDEPRMYDVGGQGGASRQWMTMTMYIYELGWIRLNFGQASAVAWLLFLIILVIGGVNFVLTRRIASSGGPRVTRAGRRAARGPQLRDRRHHHVAVGGLLLHSGGILIR